MYVLAVIPAIALLCVVWKLDTVEKEPPALLARLFAFGALTVVSAILVGLIGNGIVNAAYSGSGRIFFIFLDSFIFTALAQEAGKFFVLKMATWKNREFNYTFDGLVYAVAVSLGFAVAENIVYVVRSGADASISRVVLSVAGHLVYSMFMGCFYGQARYAEGEGKRKRVRMHLAEAVLIPAVMNGFYVFGLRTDSKAVFVFLAVYEVLITTIAIRQLIIYSREDTLIPGMEWTVRPDDRTWEDKADEG